MGTVVVTGGSRGFGHALAQAFLEQGRDVVICGRVAAQVERAVSSLSAVTRPSGPRGRVAGMVCDVRRKPSVQAVWDRGVALFGEVDVWVNNAGVNQSGDALWHLDEQDVERVLQTNLSGVIYGSQVAMNGMLRQGRGQIFNVEGFGSNGMMRRGLNLYGTSKRAVTHFTQAMARETAGTPIQVGLLRPGMMVTDFLRDSSGNFPATKRFRAALRIVGDRPLPVARFMVENMLKNDRNGAHIVWLTRRRVWGRIVQSLFVKRDLGV